ncbi:MAG: trehalase family glycosidase [Planctomycetaceae bacterium]|nr:hypothetical protein [Planctomycetaceae bacterium]
MPRTLSPQFKTFTADLARGWNTWNTRSVTSHVLMPSGLAINLGLKEIDEAQHLDEILIGRQGALEEQVTVGPRTYDGRYTELKLDWRGVTLTIQTALDGQDWVALARASTTQANAPLLIANAGVMFNRPGCASREGETLRLQAGDLEVRVHATAPHVDDPYTRCTGPYLALKLDAPVGLSTGRPRTLAEIEAVIAGARAAQLKSFEKWGELAAQYEAMQSILAWNTIYDPQTDRVSTQVSRLWNTWCWGGWILFEWDTYFAAAMAGVDNEALACANAIAITQEVTENGFVPNAAAGRGYVCRDHSEPPVGAITVRDLYARWGNRWLLEETYPGLLSWNRWWAAKRDTDGYLCLGSTPFEPVLNIPLETGNVGKAAGAILESGLDTSPMYDDVPYDEQRHQLKLADAGLMGLYVADCDALAEIARAMGRTDDAAELRTRGEKYRLKLQDLWDDQRGLFYNLRLDTREFSRRISPTNFYPLLARAASPEQADRMINEHFYNPTEFWGTWILPSISRDDARYKEQHHWRGRIWAPMNWLVYLGLRNYDTPAARRARADLVERSTALLMKEWNEKRHVHENYNANTGEGCDHYMSDRFYHWGALLALMALKESGRT